MSFKKNIIDGAMLFCVVIGATSYILFHSHIAALVLFVIAVSIGWFRRALYKVMPSF